MADTNSEFGKGIFDDDVADVDLNPEPSEDTAPEADSKADDKIELTDREKAIARGDNPDEVEKSKKKEPDPEPEEETESPPEEEEEETVEWSASDKRLASMYGLSEEDLSGFDSPGSLHAAIDLLESRKDAEAKDQADSSSDTASSDADSKDGAISDVLGFEKTDVEALEKKFNAVDEDGDRVWDKETAEQLIEQAKHTRRIEDALEKALSKIEDTSSKTEEAAVQQQQAEALRQFNDALDNIEGLYGKGDKVTEAHQKARNEVAEHTERLYAGYLSRGETPPSIAELVDQAVNAVHGKQRLEAQKRIETLRQRSKERRSPGQKVNPPRKVDPEKDPYSPEAIADSPALVEFFENAQLQNG